MSRTLFRSVLELRTQALRPASSASSTSTAPLQCRRSIVSTTKPKKTAPPSTIASQTRASSTQPLTPPPSSQPTAAPATTTAAAAAAATKKTIQDLYPPQTPSQTPGPVSDSVRQLLPLLAAQPNHYITFHIHGRPYLVQPGDAVRLPFRMPGVVPGDVLRLDCASVIGSRDFTLKGSPYVDNRLFECRAVVTGSELEPVREKVKKKRRTRRSQTVKSQHRFTTLAIMELRVKGLDEI